MKQCRPESCELRPAEGVPALFPFDVAELHKSHVTVGRFTQK